MTDWTSVEDSLPDHDTDELFWVWGPALGILAEGDTEGPQLASRQTDQVIVSGRWTNVVRWASNDWHDYDDSPQTVMNVTHWQRLPIPEVPS